MSLNKAISDEAVVTLAGITKHFGEGEARVLALRGVDLTVKRGELFMLVGPSGCGKTTLISIIAGILEKDSGGCAVLGQDYAQLSPRGRIDFRARNVGFVFQSYNLLPALTAAENVAVPQLINGVSYGEAVSRAREVLAAVGLADRADALPKALSGGQQQRVAIARAFVHRPGLVVCDEPTSALDHETGQKVMALMQKAVQEFGATLIIVTHDNRIFHYADRIAHMDDGRVDRVIADTAAYARETGVQTQGVSHASL